MINGSVFALAIALGSATPSTDFSNVDPLAAFSGAWKMVDTKNGKVLADCEKAQVFEVASDRKTVMLTEKTVDDWSARYLVLRNEKNRVLMFIDDEKRVTDWGDPVLWWAHFDGPDRFRWRRYDWHPDNRTSTEWRRCPAT